MSLIPISTYKLANGLTLIHSRDTSTAMAALTITYNVGARDEDPALTGLAHLFEHMMFAGSEHVPSFDAALTAAGGDNNAFTSCDFTTFYDVMPARNIETAFMLESDRMLNPTLDAEKLEIQRSVVIEEFKQQCLNQPYGDSSHHLYPMLYPEGHPYRHPTIGVNIDHIRRISRNDLRKWHKRFYTPANAVIAVTGNVSFEKAVALTEKWFGDIPSGQKTARNVPTVMPPKKLVEKTVYGNVPFTLLTISYLCGAYADMSPVACDAYTDLIADGKASVFHKAFRSNPSSPISDADASVNILEHQGLLTLNARIDEKISPQTAAEILIDTAKSVLRNGITTDQLQRIRNKRRSAYMMNNLDFLSRGQNLAFAAIRGEFNDESLTRFLNMSADDIIGQTGKILSENPAVLIYSPQQQSV